MARVVAIGECMVELALADANQAALGYAGDTFNAAVYMRRLGLEVSYATAIGRGDPFSAAILRRMAEEGIDVSLVGLADGRLPGLYAIQRDLAGDRRFYYWRAEAPVRQLFELVSEPLLRNALRRAQLVYVSGITLAVLGRGRAKLRALLAEAAQAGAAVALDVNYRAQLWPTAQAARLAIEELAPLCTYVSASEEDAAALGGWSFPAGAETIERLADRTVKVRSKEGDLEFRPAKAEITVVDTAGAGDAFNAAYLASRQAGRRVAGAVTAGRALAEAVIARRGAIIPASAMPRLEIEA